MGEKGFFKKKGCECSSELRVLSISCLKQGGPPIGRISLLHVTFSGVQITNKQVWYSVHSGNDATCGLLPMKIRLQTKTPTL